MRVCCDAVCGFLCTAFDDDCGRGLGRREVPLSLPRVLQCLCVCVCMCGMCVYMCVVCCVCCCVLCVLLGGGGEWV